ncbi:uncharacterized protein, partial [Mycetomoellerius zeteki]|uniref:uncharacterized protein n=1 Tax=Mycetomoellerius zeteki TaxID=64791 RepID=UPI00084E63A9
NEEEHNDEDSEYVPSEQSFSHDSESPQNNISNKTSTSRNNKSSQNNTNETSISSFNASESNIIITSSCNDELMHVQNSKIKSTKRNCCVFCKKLQSQLARHLETVHGNELEVQKFAVLPKNNLERKEIINNLRKKGNFMFNTDIEINNGELLVSRRPNENINKTATDFAPCPKCCGYFAKHTLRHHVRKCSKKDFRKNKIIMTMSRKVARRIHQRANELLRNVVFPIMRDDTVTRIVRYDELLIIYGTLKKINKTTEDFQSLYHPKVYDDCISAINVVAGYDSEQVLYKTPAVAASLTSYIKYIGNLLIIECIKKEDEKKKKLVEDFLKLLVMDVSTSVNKTVLETQSAIKRLTLTSMHVFNRRRAGEIERVLIQDFESYERLNENMYSDIYNSLSAKDKKTAQKYVRFCIRGKLGRTVLVLLPNDLFKCVILILKFRKDANVSKKNPYIFGLPSLNKQRFRYLRACVLMRKFAKECNASHSTTLRGTTLRKHIATHCIQFNLNDTEVTDLAKFMGHEDKIHRVHYRQSQASTDILKISQYLEAVQGNVSSNAQNSNDESDSDMELEDQNNSEVNICSNNEI